ncbi:Exportin 7 [Tritrichomonas musculus]|uniref:Exportin 7 n=1 Tax=Tritrichomonas musculus TaxID=1915356 RepID=A0ABR2H4I3_9EUKA
MILKKLILITTFLNYRKVTNNEMTEQMNAESFSEYFSQILNDPSSTESAHRIDYISNHVSYLDFLLQILPNCINNDEPNNTKFLVLTFIIIVLILKKRGGLLSVDFLQKQIEYLLSFITSNANLLINDKKLIIFCSDAVAYSYRFLFESTVPQAPSFDALFSLYNEQNFAFKMIALSIMKSVVVAMKDFELKHLLEDKQEDNVILFQRLYISPYFKIAADILLNNNANLIDPALELLVGCFQMFERRREFAEIDRYIFNPPPDILPYYQNNDNALPNTLFHLFDSSEPESIREELSMKNLFYFASANEAAWLSQPLSQISFFIFTASSITNLIKSSRCQKSPKSLYLMSRLIFKLAVLKIPVKHFFQANQQIAVEFFVAVHDLTIFAFQECFLDEPTSNYLIKFWGQIVSYRFDQSSVSPEFMQLFPKIFNSCIEALVNQNDEKIIQHVYDFEMSQYIDNSKYLWQIASIDQQSCANCISNALGNSTQLLLSNSLDQNSKSILCKIICLILIITGQFINRISSIYHDNDLISKNVILITAIYNFINITNDVISNIVQLAIQSDDPIFLKLLAKAEIALKCFTNAISRDYFVQGSQLPPIVKKILMSLQICDNPSCEYRKQFIFDMLFNRFLLDFKVFNDPELLDELLKFIDTFIFKGTKEVKTLSQNNVLLQSLIQRKFILEFTQSSETVSIGKLYKLLNKLYVRSIQTVEQFEAFLPYFDDRFANLKATGYQNAEVIYVLYSELQGALKGNRATDLYYFLFHWFMTQHVDDTINCILNHNNNSKIVESIAKTWSSLCPTKGPQLILPKHSAEGIKLFQCSLRVIQALISAANVDINDRKKYIIKIIAPSVSYKNNYVNFGIMEYFKDNSFESMVDIFFIIIRNWQVQIDGNSKMIELNNSIIQSIIQIKPNLISDEDKLLSITQFLYRASTKISDRVKIADIKDIFDTLSSLMELFIENDNPGRISTFRPHFIQIMELLINSHESISDKVSTPIYYMLLYDGNWVSHAFDLICSLFDQKNKEEISELFKVTFTVDFTPPPKENGIRQLRSNLMKTFSKNIIKYATSIYDIEEFCQISANLN